MPAEITQITGLERIYADNNQLDSLPTNFGNLTKLKTLNLANNNLTGLPASIVNITGRITVDLSGNKICEILDPAVKAWADKNDKDWATTQDPGACSPVIMGRPERGAAVPMVRFSNGLVHVKIPKGGLVKLEVLDLMGKSIRLLVHGTFASGDNVKVDCSVLKHGMYLFKLTAGSQTFIQKIAIL